MGKIRTYLFLWMLLACTSSFGQTYPIQDAGFRKLLSTNYPSVLNSNQELVIANAAALTGVFYCGESNIVSLDGIQYFTGITTLYCFKNTITDLSPIANLTNLVTIDCYQNQLTSLPSFAALTNLESLNVAENQISAFPSLNGLAKLKKLLLYRNRLTTVPDLSQLTVLEEFHCYENQITAMGKMPASLKVLWIGDNLITQLPDISLATGLTRIGAYTCRLTSVPDLSGYASLTELNIGTNNLSSPPPNLSLMTGLATLTLDNNNLNTLPDLSALTQLNYCWLQNNNFTFEDLDPSSDNPYFTSWILAPQDSVPVQSFHKEKENHSLTISLNLDATVGGLTYSWYQNGTLRTQTNQPVLSFSSLKRSDNGTYHCVVSSSNPNYGTFTLATQKFTISVLPEFIFEKELTLTPDGDGRNDEFLFEDKGILKVYNSAGQQLDEQSAPCYWNGTTRSGKELGTGFYIIRINDDITYAITILR